MTGDDWARVKEIASAALELDEAARPGFVAARCGADEGLRGEVLSLLHAMAQAADLFETPRLRGAETLASLIEAGDPRPSAVGMRIGPYRIETRSWDGAEWERCFSRSAPTRPTRNASPSSDHTRDAHRLHPATLPDREADPRRPRTPGDRVPLRRRDHRRGAALLRHGVRGRRADPGVLRYPPRPAVAIGFNSFGSFAKPCSMPTRASWCTAI